MDRASADVAIVQFNTHTGTGGGGTPTVGWEFTPTRQIQVTKLGYYDADSNGFLASHDLGIYEVPTKTLLTTATIPAGVAAPIEGPTILFEHTLPVGNFRYVSTSTVVLQPGVNYIVAGTPAGYIDQTATFNPNDARDNLEIAPDINYSHSRYNSFTPAGLAFPVEINYAPLAIGPSFEFVVVPEPSALVLAMFGAVALLATIKRRSYAGTSPICRGR